MSGVETPKALAAFRAYCALGPKRSLAKLSQAGQSSLRYLEAWSAKYDWQRRAAEYDGEHEAALEAERVKRDADAEEARREMLDRHAARSRDLFAVGADRLVALAQRDDLDASSAVRLVQVSSALERLARGVNETVRHQVTGIVTLDQLSQMAREVDDEQAEWERERGYNAHAQRDEGGSGGVAFDGIGAARDPTAAFGAGGDGLGSGDDGETA